MRTTSAVKKRIGWNHRRSIREWMRWGSRRWWWRGVYDSSTRRHIGMEEGNTWVIGRINTIMVGEFMLFKVVRNMIASVLSDKGGVGLVTRASKSSINHRNQVASVVNRGITCNSAFALKLKSAVCFFVFWAMRKPSRKHSQYKGTSELVHRNKRETVRGSST